VQVTVISLYAGWISGFMAGFGQFGVPSLDGAGRLRFKGPASVAADPGRDKRFRKCRLTWPVPSGPAAQPEAPLSTKTVDNSVSERSGRGKISRLYCIFIAMAKK
jgi:hypothetical protein